MNNDDTPALDGVHHLKLPVGDIERSRSWYASRLGYVTVIEFTGNGRTTGITMAHPDGGPMIGFVLDSERARRASGFDYFAIGVPGRAELERLAARLTALGEEHAGVHFATIGWILPGTHDPDGHEVRFYTTGHHTPIPADGTPLVVDDPIGTEAERRRAHAARGTDEPGTARSSRSDDRP
ncbi:VOC family protein [Actinomadura sp. NAK00032]|uniref:VOC family protein n=1 Tax=Actinomadura sp. NAK00032 TaxID=2742128 RepID=UPI00158FA390|nr:VOC family protein [Actinomadura sp. NAK00032]QKW38074.1 VOC family protein [Actinomadura sp. NAK00032]